MNILAFDCGSYSLKAFFLKKERKFLRIDHIDEIFHNDYFLEQPELENKDYMEVNFHILSEYLEQLREDKSLEGRRIAFQYPLSLHSFRFLELPPVSLKKAELMVPFQLEDGLPLPLQQMHICQEITPAKERLDVAAFITSSKSFKSFIDDLESFNIVPDYLTSEISLINAYAASMKIDKPFTILDIGHSFTKAYFINNNQVVSAHLSNFGGKLLNEIISKSYQISLDEAATYKHEHAFFLTGQQVSTSTKDQVQFSSLMGQAIAPLIHDFKMWELGLRVKLAQSVSKVMITGGTSKIHNIDLYLSEELEHTVSKVHLDALFPKDTISNIPEHNNGKLFAPLLYSNKHVTNFLSGLFTINDKNIISINKTIFYCLRFILIGACFSFFMIVDSIYTNQKSKSELQTLSKAFKNPTLGMTARDRSYLKRTPLRIVNKLQKMKSKSFKELNFIETQLNNSPLSGLTKLSNQLNGLPNDSFVTSYKETTNNIKFTIKSKNNNSYEKLKNKISNIKLNSFFFEPNDNELELTGSFKN